MEIKHLGVYADWTDIFKKMSLDVPYYTALRGRACILVKISNRVVPEFPPVQNAIASAQPLALQVEAFLAASFPILRCNFLFPDSTHVLFESPLDVSDGDVQDFFNAVQQDETIDIILTHEQLGGKTHSAFACEASGLAPTLFREIQRVLSALKPGATAQDFQKSIAHMESTFPSCWTGVSPAKCVKLRPIGEAKHNTITY